MRQNPHWPLLLLPGTLCDARVFDLWLEAMAADPAMMGRAVLAADMSGCDSVAALAKRVLDTGPERFIAVGFSLGAIVTLELARIAPERVAAMALVGDVSWPRSVAPARYDDIALRQLIIAMARSAPPGTLAMPTEAALTRIDQRAHLGEMTMPALVLGGALDVIAPSALQHELAEGLPNAALHIATDAGHFLPLERPDFCARALAGWLASGSGKI